MNDSKSTNVFGCFEKSEPYLLGALEMIILRQIEQAARGLQHCWIGVTITMCTNKNRTTYTVLKIS